MLTLTAQKLAEMDRPPCYHRTLFHLLAKLDCIQFRRLSASEIAEHTKQSVSSAERAMTMLKADRVIIPEPDPMRGRMIAIRLNRHLASTTTAQKWGEQEDDPEVIDARGR